MQMFTAYAYRSYCYYYGSGHFCCGRAGEAGV